MPCGGKRLLLPETMTVWMGKGLFGVFLCQVVVFFFSLPKVLNKIAKNAYAGGILKADVSFIYWPSFIGALFFKPIANPIAASESA